ncbi:hypothetical protein BDR05DRAFT_50526 [Suillus weaverae]|nr:hypothetical protein BDR05DRAFT_50526 [Suillus weaverae]
MTGVTRKSFNNRSNRRGSWLGPLMSSHLTGSTDLSPALLFELLPYPEGMRSFIPSSLGTIRCTRYMRGTCHLAPRIFSLSRSPLHAARPISCILGIFGFPHIIFLNAVIMKTLFC